MLTPVDAAWFRMDNDVNQADIAALMLFDGPLDEMRFRRTLEERLLIHERFRKRVVDSKGKVAPPRWEDERQFSLDDHFRRMVVPGGDAGLPAALGTLSSTRLELDRSPWQIVLLDGLSVGTGLFVRLHHCMGDGFALLDILVSLADRPGSEPKPEPELQPKPKPEPKPELQPKPEPDSVRERQVAPSSRPWRALFGDGPQLASSLAHLVFLPFDPPSALRGRLSGERRLAWSEPIAVADVKALARAEGGTINDVILAALTGAFRRALLEATAGARSGIAPNIRAIVPVNLRPKDRPIDLERGNWFGLMFVDLPTAVADERERFATLKRSLERAKQSKEALVTLGVLAALGRLPGVVDQLADAFFSRKASAVVTNVPGPRERLVLAGRTMLDLLFWVPHPSGLACGASVMSYAGTIRVGIRTDASVIEDPARLAQLFAEELARWPSRA